MNKFLFVVFFLVNYATAEINLGDVVDLCDPSSSQLDDCLLRAANKMVPFLAKGVEELDIPVLDPLKMSKVDFGAIKKPVNFQFALYDTVQNGLSSVVFDSARSNFGKGVLEFNGTLPHFHVEGKFKGNGKTFLFFIPEEGTANFEFYNMKISVRLQVESGPCQGGFYCLNVKTLELFYIFNEIQISFSQLSNNNNKRLDNLLKKFIASNEKENFSVIQSALAKNYSPIFLSVLRKLFKNIPIQQLFKTL